MSTDLNNHFASVAGPWDQLRPEYFREHLREAAVARTRLPGAAVGGLS